MAAKLLTDRKIITAKAVGAERLLADGDGLYLRIRPAGRDWLFIYSLAGKRRKMGLGPYPDVSLEKARLRAQEARETVADKQDPMAARDAADSERRAQEAAAANRHTIRTLFELWHKREASKNWKDAGAEVRRIFEKDVLPKLGEMFAESVQRRHVLELLDAIKERGVTVTVNKALLHMRALFKFAVLREIVTSDPTYGISRRDAGGDEPERRRYLTEDEVRELAAKLPAAGLTDQAEAALWALLATACRVGELSRARKADVDLQARIWKIPAEHAKNGEMHLVHLSDFAATQFETLLQLSRSDTWLLPSLDASGHLDLKALQRQYRDRQRAQPLKGRSANAGTLLLVGGEWRAHDLRRTAATLMGELGVQEAVIERCLNHVGAKLKRTYQRQETLAARAEAFDLLGERLALLARGERAKVVAGKFGRVA